jgi:signal peptidase I
LRTIFKIIFWSLFIWFILRTFFFQIYRIPSASMQGTLFESDRVVINKFSFGARFPITPLSVKWSGQKRYINFTLPYFRLPGYSTIHRNDIVAFNYALTDDEPIDMREEFIKRCVALPGDTVNIASGDIYINKQLVNVPNAYINFVVRASQILDTTFFSQYKILKQNVSVANSEYFVTISNEQSLQLKSNPIITSITKNFIKASEYSPHVFPHFASHLWNLDFFGPLYIPKKNDSILLNQTNLHLYENCITRFEKKSITLKNDSIFVNQKYAPVYCFTQNYYFLLGDNRYNSIDSRIWGFIPESHIIGKVSYVYRK